MRSLKSTTAALVALSLSAPAPVFAQGQGQGEAKGLLKQLARELGVEVCEDGGAVPCVDESGALLIDQPDLAATLVACDNTALPCATDAGLVLVEPSSELALQALFSGSEEMAEETPEETAEPTETTVAEETESEPEQAEDTATAATEAEQPAEEVAAEETPAAEATESVESVSADTEETTEESAPAAESTAQEEAVTVEETAPEVPATEDAGATDTAAAAATAEDSAATAEVVTEEVTEETARSSSEDFQTAVTGTATAEVKQPEDKGLSNFEKALLIGLGTVAVGSILKSGEEVVSNSGDRVVLQDNSGNLRVLKNDDALLRQPGSQVQTETFSDGSTRTTVLREDGTKIVTIRDADGRVLRRVREFADGSRVVLFDDTEVSEPVDVSRLPDVEVSRIEVDTTDEDALRRALEEAQARDVGRRFSLAQVRQIREVRELAPELDLDAITFATGSAAIEPSQAEELTALGRAMRRIIDDRPGEVFLIEGHTDAVGSATYNLALSDRRAETVALALTEYFDVPPENMITQGYGESALKIPTDEAERLNRRATIRRITPLLRQVALNR